MTDYLMSVKQMILQLHGIEKGIDETNVFQMPDNLIQYLDVRRNSASNITCRAQDSMQHHLSWHMYLTEFITENPICDMVAWEILYEELHSSLEVPFEALHCLQMKMSSDPARPYVMCMGLKPHLHQDKTSPEYVALFHSVSEDLDLDITELKTPVLVLTPEDIENVNAQIKHHIGIEMDAIELITSIPQGQDVFLA